MRSQPFIEDIAASGAMMMKPLLLHASGKRTSEQNRRVIHLEFDSKKLPGGLLWREYENRHSLLQKMK